MAMLWFGVVLLVLVGVCLAGARLADVRALRRGGGELRDARAIDIGVYEVNKVVGAARCGRFRREDSRPRRPA
jgi:hypothetical protein